MALESDFSFESILGTWFLLQIICNRGQMETHVRQYGLKHHATFSNIVEKWTTSYRYISIEFLSLREVDAVIANAKARAIKILWQRMANIHHKATRIVVAKVCYLVFVKER